MTKANKFMTADEKEYRRQTTLFLKVSNYSDKTIKFMFDNNEESIKKFGVKDKAGSFLATPETIGHKMIDWYMEYLIREEKKKQATQQLVG
ncbi:hypothetical protein FC36_GL002109 [Ligilactobacillus equi DSM 15833 = JCM 10991]|uniref:Uncharacterized protein n=2 Tax=Ligilactobacillus equi TaxID=137357 RepID=A0A0R1THE1_9LACO|nr:hypothetical protein [Ligilactobacillus equi]KRL80653.1 hypothetical protein FC36_GL002109 [Ligilactobacillus equi DSM 15833 = JCM 10991]